MLVWILSDTAADDAESGSALILSDRLRVIYHLAVMQTLFGVSKRPLAEPRIDGTNANPERTR